MQIRIPNKIFEQVLRDTKSKVLEDAKVAAARFGSAVPKYTDIEGNRLDKPTLKALYEATKDKDTEYSNNIEFLWRALKKPSSITIKKMADIEPGLNAYLKSSGIKNYVFKRGSHKALLGYVVVSVTNTRRNAGRYRDSTPVDHIVVTLAYSSEDEAQSKSISFSPHTLSAIFDDNGVTYEEKTVIRGSGEEKYEVHTDTVSDEGISIDKLLSHEDMFLESEELHEAFDKQTNNYFRYIKMYGQQFRVRGIGRQESTSYWSSGEQSMLTDGKPGRAIMNAVPRALFPESEDNNKMRRKRTFSFYRNRDGDEDMSVDDQLPNDPVELKAMYEELTPEDFEHKVKVTFGGEAEVVIPIHPTLRIYHMLKMENYVVHVNNLMPYKYQDDIQDKLILPKEVKQMTQMLVANSATGAADIVEGKSQSTILCCVGDPGLGKTLLAEVMSEASKKPLYKVQAAQLGLEPQELERSLQRILNQAQRWNAVLMIDEANAYIHSRGHDIKQNAIVGVFLRLLEFYRGIMIITTNMTAKNVESLEDGEATTSEDMGFDVDGAILNRCTAVFRFTMPPRAAALRIWKMQAETMGIELPDELASELSKTFVLSGRSIRNLLRLSARWSEHLKEDLDMTHFKTCAKVIPKTASEKVPD